MTDNTSEDNQVQRISDKVGHDSPILPKGQLIQQIHSKAEQNTERSANIIQEDYYDAVQNKSKTKVNSKSQSGDQSGTPAASSET